MIAVEEALLEVAGVAEASVEFSDGAPVGVRVVLEAGADEKIVASSVRDVLTSHGLRSRLAPRRGKLEPISPPPPPGSSGPRPLVVPIADEEVGDLADAEDHEAYGPVEVSVAEALDPVQVTVFDASGNRSVRTSRLASGAVHQAIGAAVAALVDPDGPVPTVVMVDFQSASGIEFVTVVLEPIAGELVAGAAVVKATREFAVAQAAWRALVS